MKKMLLFLFLAVLTLSLPGCGASAEMPEDFSFRLTWGVYGVSSYDSAAGRLVKTTDATHPEDYTAALQLTEDQLQQVWDAVSALDLDSYPDEYDPTPGIAAEPSETLILTVSYGAYEKTVSCQGVAGVSVLSKSAGEGRKFLAACKTIQELLTATDAWNALPDYEFYYD